jgi:hypothetical protein
MLPPIYPKSPDYAIFWKSIFAHYLRYALKNGKGDYINHCSYHYSNAFESSANSLDAWAVGVCVAVEGVANLIPLKMPVYKRKQLDKFSKKVKEYVCGADLPPDLTDRLLGLLGMMADPRVQDRLSSLTKKGYTNSVYVSSWKKLRNSNVHPKSSQLKAVPADLVQKKFDQVHQVEVLLHQIIFFLIGYKGIYTNYGVHGFPAARYPVPMPGR